MMQSSTFPGWLTGLLGAPAPAEGGTIEVRGIELTTRKSILRAANLMSDGQDQTKEVFGFKWHQRETFESEEMRAHARNWLNERYGPAKHHEFLCGQPVHPIVLDAGCGAGFAGLEYFADVLDNIHYVGVDISSAVDVAAARFSQREIREAAFLQVDITHLPLSPGSVDVVFSEGVMHHTDSTETALKYLSSLLKPGGYFMFYVYAKKGPVREFTDDYVRSKIRAMTPEQAWESLLPVTRLGKALGDLNIDIEIPENIDLLDIPAGRINLQRFFYWHVFKAFYRPELSLEEMNHINFDWYAPANAYRQSPNEVRAWCAQAGLEIVREVVENAGITIVAKKSVTDADRP